MHAGGEQPVSRLIVAVALEDLGGGYQLDAPVDGRALGWRERSAS